MQNSSRVLMLLLALTITPVSVPFRSSASDSPSRLTVLISDLHFGVGLTASGWHPTEDSRWAVEFEHFLNEIHARGEGSTDLILNGDTFELWQSLAQFTSSPDCTSTDPNLGCTVAEALARLRVVIHGHQRELKAIGAFANKGNNQVVLVPGNHDAALLWPDVAAETLSAIGGNPGRVQIASSGYWLSTDGRVLAEHGHQVGEDPNKFCGGPSPPCAWPRPFLASGLGRHLHRPWGEIFVQDFYNKYELDYPIIDNLSSESIGLEYGVSASGFTGSLTGALRFLRFFLVQQSWAQFGQVLGDPKSRVPEWDLKAIRQGNPSTFLLDSLPANSAVKLALSAQPLPPLDTPLDDSEIRAICDKRELLNLQNQGTGTVVVPCPRLPDTLRGLNQYLLGSKNAIFARHLKSRRDSLPGAASSPTNFEVFVYSHTHQAEQASSPLADASDRILVEVAPGRTVPWLPLVLNTGAWQRVVNEDQIRVLRREQRIISEGRIRVLPRERELTKTEFLKLTAEDLPACYSAVIIDQRDSPLDPVLRWWHLAADGQWKLSPEAEAPECPQSKGPGIAPPGQQKE